MPMTAVLAKDLLNVYFNPKAADLALTDYKPGDKLVPFKVVGEWKGPELAGMHYEQLIPWVNPGEGAFRVITGDYVTVEDGYGYRTYRSDLSVRMTTVWQKQAAYLL